MRAAWLARLLLPRMRAIAARRLPDVVIGGYETPYLLRWHLLPRNRFLNVYLHQFRRSDDDRALHDHPWINASLVLDGVYVEHTQGRVRWRIAGDLACRRARTAHRIALPDGRPVWTLFVTGPRVREWGFLCPQGWRPWRDFTTPDGGRVGRGCN